MEKEEIRTIYQRLKPAEETLRRLAEGDKRFNHLDNSMSDLNLKFELMQKDIQNICEKLEQNAEEHKAIMSKMDEFLKGCDTRYASKNVEKILLWAGAIIGAGIIGAILKTILK